MLDLKKEFDDYCENTVDNIVFESEYMQKMDEAKDKDEAFDFGFQFAIEELKKFLINNGVKI